MLRFRREFAIKWGQHAPFIERNNLILSIIRTKNSEIWLKKGQYLSV